jgi:hypothetical protein
MKSKIILGIVFITVQLALAWISYIPKFKEILPPSPTSREQLDWEIRILGTEFALLTAYVGLLLLLREHENSKFQKSLLTRIPAVRVQRLRDDEFYKEFLDRARNAQNTVNITYLAAYPPDEVNNRTRATYDRDLINTIRQRPHVRFRRIVRSSHRNRPWIAELTEHLQNLPNADLAVLRESEREEMPQALSVQIVDERSIWFVAINAHERVGAYRDLVIESQEAAQAMQDYYDRLWGRATRILDSGRITPEGHRILTEAIPDAGGRPEGT